MSNKSVLANSIAHIKHLAAFDFLVKKRLEKIGLDQLLIYIIDTVNANAIPYLATQFDVVGHKGFRQATTDKEKREIIKKSIHLHRFKGTFWAVREALTTVGYADALIEEHINHWANFRITISLGEKSLSEGEVQNIVKMIHEYKNARSHLIDISYTISVSSDNIYISDTETDAQAIDDQDIVTAGGDFKHDGSVRRDGSRNYSMDSDTLNLNLIII